MFNKCLIWQIFNVVGIIERDHLILSLFTSSFLFDYFVRSVENDSGVTTQNIQTRNTIKILVTFKIEKMLYKGNCPTSSFFRRTCHSFLK